jgi:hypothetical protein
VHPLSACIVTVCRGCCCGTTAAQPDVDHERHLALLKAVPGARVRTSQCLAACELSNMVVVNPSADGRANGGRPAWLGGVVTDEEITLIAGWVEAGGPGVAPMPADLSLNLQAVHALAARIAGTSS